MKTTNPVVFKNADVFITLRQDKEHGAYILTQTHYKNKRRDHTDVEAFDASEDEDAWAGFRDAVEAYISEEEWL